VPRPRAGRRRREPAGRRGRYLRRPEGDGAMSGEAINGEAMGWREAHQRHLPAALALVRGALDRHAGGPEPGLEAAKALEEAAAAMPAPPALEVVRERFGLSAFERDVLLLCAGVELDSGFAARCAAAQGEGNRRQP